MAKAHLTFTLPEEQSDFDNALQGTACKLVLWSVDVYLRNRLKYEELRPSARRALQDARDELRAMCDEHRVSLDE